MSDSKVVFKENGPILIAGKAVYRDADGNEQTTQGTMFALCRCGHSANKPFCDGAHKRSDFAAEGQEMTLSKE